MYLGNNIASLSSGRGCIGSQGTSGTSFWVLCPLTHFWTSCWAVWLTWVESLRGRTLCGSLNSSLDSWWWRLKLCLQTRQQEGVKHWSLSQLRSQKKNYLPCGAQDAHIEGLQERRYFQLPLSAHKTLFPLSLPSLSPDFPVGHWSVWNGKFSCWFSVP